MIKSRVHPKKISLQLYHDPSEFGRVIGFRQGGMTNVESPYIRTVPSHHGSPILGMGDPAYALDRTAALFFFLTFSKLGSPYRSWVTGQSIRGGGARLHKEELFLKLKSQSRRFLSI